MNDNVTPTLAFGDGNSGFYEETDNDVIYSAAGTPMMKLHSSGVSIYASNRARMRNTAPSATNPSFVPDQGDTNTGIGQAASDQLSLIAGGVEGIRINDVGDIDITPTSNTNVSTSPLLIQNVSQNDTPGTTVDGQIRLWEDADAGGGASDGRILYQINGTTYQLNADAGITFTNNPLILARDKALFTAGHAQWKLDRIDDADDDFMAYSNANPGLNLSRIEPVWSIEYLNHLNAQYTIARDALEDDADDSDIPSVSTVAQLRAENPWPDPDTYTIADAENNETASRSGANFVVDDPVVLVVDRLKFNNSADENWGVHTVPSKLTEEFIRLLQTDAAFLNQVKSLLGL